MLTLSQPSIDHPPDTEEPARPAASLWLIHRASIARILRYSAVSLVATATSTISLGVMVGLIGMAAVWSNIAATAIGTIPSFELNRRWVWKRTDQCSVLRQVVPFCALSFAGLVVSTVAVGVVSDYTSGWSRMDHTLAVELANLAAYGSLWVIQYQLLNRFLFATRPEDPLPPTGQQSALPSAGPQTTMPPVGQQTTHGRDRASAATPDDSACTTTAVR
jgi:putative flippase GtrA